MKIWVDNAPLLDSRLTDSNEIAENERQVAEFIMRHITVELPDESKDPVLHQLVTTLQVLMICCC